MRNFDQYKFKNESGEPIFFLHLEPYGRTVALLAPLVDDLNYAVNEFIDGAKRSPDDDGAAGRFTLAIGVSKLHPKDRYIKKIGRQVATSKMIRDYGYVERAFIDQKGIAYVVRYQDIVINLLAKHGEPKAYVTNGLVKITIYASGGIMNP